MNPESCTDGESIGRTSYYPGVFRRRGVRSAPVGHQHTGDPDVDVRRRRRCTRTARLRRSRHHSRRGSIVVPIAETQIVSNAGGTRLGTSVPQLRASEFAFDHRLALLVVPSDLALVRMIIGVRSFSEGARITVRITGRNGIVKAETTRTYSRARGSTWSDPNISSMPGVRSAQPKIRRPKRINADPAMQIAAPARSVMLGRTRSTTASQASEATI